MSKQAFVDFKKRLDYSEYGGAPLLGVKGVCIISHGSSNANAIKNAIRVASEFATSEMNGVIESEIADANRHLEIHNGKSAAGLTRRGPWAAAWISGVRTAFGSLIFIAVHRLNR